MNTSKNMGPSSQGIPKAGKKRSFRVLDLLLLSCIILCVLIGIFGNVVPVFQYETSNPVYVAAPNIDGVPDNILLDVEDIPSSASGNASSGDDAGQTGIGDVPNSDSAVSSDKQLSMGEPEISELLGEVKTIRDELSSLQNELLSSTAEEQQYTSEEEIAKKRLEEINKKLDSKRGEIKQLAIEEYKSPSTKNIIEVVFMSESIGKAIKNSNYAMHIIREKTRAVEEVVKLAEDQQKVTQRIQEKRIAAKESMKKTQQKMEEWENKLKEVQPRLRQIRGYLLAGLSGTFGAKQLDAALDYLENMGEDTEVQKKLLRAAYTTSYCGGNLCEKWVENVYANAGYPMKRYASAAADAKANLRCEDCSNIPVGALVYGSGIGYMGAIYGHVGICVASGTGNGDALIMDNEGARTGRAVPLKEWESWQVQHSQWNGGKTGVFGWGYPEGVKLEPAVN